jgi:putative spermidine/putrescine transport system permease protein
MKRPKINAWAWLWGALGLLYFFVPLYGTLDFSLRMIKGRLSLQAYEIVLQDPQFLNSFRYSALMGVITVIVSIAIFLPTIYWVHLRLPEARPIMDIITLLPFMVPVIVYVFGLIRTFSRPPFLLTLTPTGTDVLIAAGYVVLAMPYMYRAIDIGMRSIDVRTLTEAAESLGANGYQVLVNVILPNLRIAVLSGALISFAMVIGELILGSFLVRPALGAYMEQMGRDHAYEPAALAMMSYALTWACLGLLQFVTRGGSSQQQLTGR